VNGVDHFDHLLSSFVNVEQHHSLDDYGVGHLLKLLGRESETAGRGNFRFLLVAEGAGTLVWFRDQKHHSPIQYIGGGVIDICKWTEVEAEKFFDTHDANVINKQELSQWVRESGGCCSFKRLENLVFSSMNKDEHIQELLKISDMWQKASQVHGGSYAAMLFLRAAAWQA
jgi:acyl-coenzyme A thioesterase PaaI-like protein